MITLFYTTSEGDRFRPVRTSATMTQIKKGLRRGVLILPERTVKFFAVLLPSGEIFDVLNGYRNRSEYHPGLTGFSGKKIFRRIYRSIFFTEKVSVIGGKLGSAQRILKRCRCGRMPVLSLVPFPNSHDTELIQVSCDPMTCTVSYFNPEIYSLSQAARVWNKKGRFLYDRWIRPTKYPLFRGKPLNPYLIDEIGQTDIPANEILV